MDEFLAYVELKHESLDELHHSNNVLFTIDGFISDIPYQIGEKTLSELSVNNCECAFQVLLQNLLSVNDFIYFSIQDSLLDPS